MTGIDNDQIFRTPDLVAVLTGGGSGLGRMMARALASSGANRIYIIGRRLEKLQETAIGYEEAIIPIQGDVTSKDSLKSIADRARSEIGYLNLLIVNSGITGPLMDKVPKDPSISELSQHFWSFSSSEINEVFELNNTAAFFTMVAFLELLDAGNKAGGGIVKSQIINTASIAGYMRALSTGPAYLPSKAALIHQTKMFATYLAKYGIRVNALAPGIYPNEMTDGFVGAVEGFSVETIPAGRLGSEEDMRGPILFLTSRAGAYLNGMVFLSDGGRLSQLPAPY